MRRKCHFARVVLTIGLALWLGPASNSAAADSKTWAVLVGVSHYDHIANHDLMGPANDVPLLVEVLKQQFSVQAAGIKTLTEADGEANASLRPTKANIERALEELAGGVQAGDQVLIYLSGHGTQQLANADDLEPDGLDEVFLPADAKRDGNGKELSNVLSDDELRKWLHRIAGQGALIWFIADCCHSGTLARGEREFTTQRRVTAGQIFGREVSDEISRRQRQSTVVKAPLANSKESGLPPGLVAIYAARSHEPTLERPFPSATRPNEQDVYGLLTYSLIKALRSYSSEAPLTYRQLVDLIRREYAGIGYTAYPVPLLEGVERDREVLGTMLGRENTRWKLNGERGKWQVAAGMLNGLTRGSILAVYPASGARNVTNRLGHVEITSAGATEAKVVPCAYKEGDQVWPMPANFPPDCQCETVFFNFGDLRLKIAVERSAAGADTLNADALRALLLDIQGRHEAPITVVDEAVNADWQIAAEGGRVFLSPTQGHFVEASAAGTEERVDALLLAEAHQKLPEQLRRIAKAELLRKIAGSYPSSQTGKSQAAVSVELLKYRDRSDRKPISLETIGQRPRLNTGDVVGFRVTNRSRQLSLYVTLLLIDSGFGIESIYPGQGEIVELLGPGASIVTDSFAVNAQTLGAESAVALAVQASGPPVDFTALTQPTLALAKSVRTQRGPAAEGSSLSRLLEDSLFVSAAARPTRGLGSVESQECATSILTWETVNASRP